MGKCVCKKKGKHEYFYFMETEQEYFLGSSDLSEEDYDEEEDSLCITKDEIQEGIEFLEGVIRYLKERQYVR